MEVFWRKSKQEQSKQGNTDPRYLFIYLFMEYCYIAQAVLKLVGSGSPLQPPCYKKMPPCLTLATIWKYTVDLVAINTGVKVGESLLKEMAIFGCSKTLSQVY